MTTREVARAKSLPVGGSASSDSGSEPNPSGIDHVHRFWGKWIEVPLLANWAMIAESNSYPVMISLCGNMVWLRGRCRWKNRVSGSTEPLVAPVTRLPVVARPDRQIVYEGMLLDTDGYLYPTTFNSSFGNPTGGGWQTISDFAVDDFIYRTKL